MTFPAAWGCASDFLKMLQKFKMATNSKFFGGQKNIKGRNYSNFTITFPTIWRCAGFFKGFAVIQNDRHESTLTFLWAQKLKTIKAEIIQIVQSHSPQYGDQMCM